MADREKLSDYAYDELKKIILNNTFKPGEHLEEISLCERLNISRTPLREALNRLMYENLLVSVPHKGIFVPEMNVQTVAELFKARKLIEPMLLLLSAPKLDREVIMGFREGTVRLMEAEDTQALHELDYKFHSYINGSCDNQFMIRMSESITDQFQRVRTRDFYPKERAVNGAAEHLVMIDKILSMEYDALPELMLDHITSTEKYYYMSLFENDLAEKNIDYLREHLQELK